MTMAISAPDVQAAAAELARMRRSLVKWLKYRAVGDQVLAGTARVRKPLAYAQRVVATARGEGFEQDLATKLAALLGALMPGQPLPSSDLTANPMGAVQLAQIALQGGGVAAGPTATGSLGAASHPWLWPVLIVGGLLLVVTTAIKTQADLAAQQEQNACIEAGACTDYGFWLKAGGILFLAWFAWEKLGVGDVARSHIKKGGS
jgi:hypothetical protein